MKKMFLSLSLSAMLIVGLSGCSKVVDQLKELFTGIEVNAPDVQITIPVIPIVPPNEMALASISSSFNLDSTIRANTANTFSSKDVTSIKVKQITVTLLNSDNSNNLSNLEYTKVSLTSNSNSTAANIATLNFPDVASSTLTVTPMESPELLSYLNGSSLTYNIVGKIRRTTSKPLNMVVTVRLRVK